MNFDYSDKTKDMIARMEAFMDEHIYPNEQQFMREVAEGDRWQPTQIIETLKDKARKAGLWNLFLPESEYGAGLTNLEYAPLCEITGRVLWAPEVFNCSAPDTGNMEVLMRYGTPAQQKEWLFPLLAGEIRSAFAMTEPDVASSDATNISISIVRDGDEYVINGRKWWTSGANDPRCKVLILMGKTDPDNASRHSQQSMILVPMDTPGITVRPIEQLTGTSEFNEVFFDDAECDAEDIVGEPGEGWKVAMGLLAVAPVAAVLLLLRMLTGR